MPKPKVLYLSYTGLMEPLGRSQILPYLSRLSDEYEFTIVSFEKVEDLKNINAVKKLHRECNQYGISWKPTKYHDKPRLLATVYDLLNLIYLTYTYCKGSNTQIVHCRSYIPTISAWLVSKVSKTPFIFDMRALWPEELIDANRLKRNSIVHKVLQLLESKLLKDASHTVSLTHAAIDYLTEVYPHLDRNKFSSITTCVDLERFQSLNSLSKEKKLGTMGTVISGWYKLDWLFRTFKIQLQLDSNSEFKIVTRDSVEYLRKLASKYDIHESKLEIISSEPKDIAYNISDLKVGLLYFTQGISKIGSAPTRMGEFLACGIPVIGNRGVGDMAQIIEDFNVGVVLESDDDESILKALIKLDKLYEDENLIKRCQDTAATYFSVEKGSEKYRQIYKKIVK